MVAGIISTPQHPEANAPAKLDSLGRQHCNKVRVVERMCTLRLTPRTLGGPSSTVLRRGQGLASASSSHTFRCTGHRAWPCQAGPTFALHSGRAAGVHEGYAALRMALCTSICRVAGSGWACPDRYEGEIASSPSYDLMERWELSRTSKLTGVCYHRWLTWYNGSLYRTQQFDSIII